MKNTPHQPRPRSLIAFLYAVPIGLLGGLIGLGGAEFRLPVLVGPLGYRARQAIPLNLAISLVTLTVSLSIRARTLSPAPIIPHISIILTLIAGAMFAAFWGAALARRLSERRLEQIICALLTLIGVMLIVEAFIPGELPAFLPSTMLWRIGAGVVFGLTIGLVSSLLGVAGGELIIPILIFAYGVDVKTAGTASLIISLPAVIVGVLRHAARKTYHDRAALMTTVGPMGAGSLIGALGGGLLAGIIPSHLLKIALGAILLFSAWHLFQE
ncbi:MAG: sulfite exporter TauE/SafE family protein [Anaerolineae bacterium]|nr:sulfite exporter TauE/SafE family protein [Anaerolineae bacterium]